MAIPGAFKGYLDLCRVSNLPSVWTNVLCAAVLANGTFSWHGYLPAALAISCFYLAGMCLNDICDAAHDTVHRPGRPIPSKAVTVRGALLLTISLAVAGMVPLFRSGHSEAVHAAFLLVAVIVWYDLDHKQNRYSVLLMASCRFLVFIVTSLALTGDATLTVWIAAALHFAYVLLLSIVARRENESPAPFPVPVIPLMLSAIPLLDGAIMAAVIAPVWLVAGFGGALLMQGGHRFVRVD